MLRLPAEDSEIGDDEPLLDHRLHLDSIATIELLSEVENAFDIQIDDDTINQSVLKSPNALAEMVARHLLLASKEQANGKPEN